MRIEVYKRLYKDNPDALIDYIERLTRGADRAEMIHISDPDSLCGPFADKYGLIVVRNHARDKNIRNIRQVRNIELEARKKYNLDMSKPFEYELVDPTIERPVTMRLMGNDDFSWGCTLPSLADADELLYGVLLKLEPWTVSQIVNGCKMIFTN
jgi:hypothetical protein